MSNQTKSKEIYTDLSHNIVFIYSRFDLYLAFDLVYHSVLSFKFQGKTINKGWCEGLIVSDTRCGKSETAEKLLKHYKLGELCSAENTSFAGLIGGMQQIGNRWHLTWGKIPINDRRLIVIDEVSGMDVETIGLMSGIRSSGVAEIVKINVEKTHARTRLIWLSNPRSNISVKAHNSGIDILRHLIGRPEDIARFDFALIMSSDEVANETINAYERMRINHVYNSKLCHDLVLWTWSRKEDQIEIGNETVKCILEETSHLCSKYSSDLPLVATSEMKIKLARLSVALAARLFSTNTTGEIIVVTPAHVRYISQWLDKIYSSPCFSYDLWSQRVKERNVLNEDRIKEILFGKSAQLRECLLEMGQIRITDIEEIIEGDRKEAKEILSSLLSAKAVHKIHGFYVKVPAFIKILRDMEVADGRIVEKAKDIFGAIEVDSTTIPQRN